MTDRVRKHVKGIDPGYLSTLTAEDPRPFDQKLVISIDGRQITLFNPDRAWTKPNFWSESPTTWTNIHFGDIHNDLVETPGPFTAEKMKTSKSLDVLLNLLSPRFVRIFYVCSADV
ncbi:hypothetical protein NL108_010253 [Boleophthalmus pectinirostris]|nr:hypothetical protein NL108_010253 [Boleophthalmus pectinirostris]